MPIQSVNGRNVYVISAEVPTAKTSTGIGYATLVTSLRWQLWEEAQKAVIQEMKREEVGYEGELKLYEAQQKELQNRIDDYDMLIAKTKAGQPIDQLRRERKLQDDQAKRDEEKRREEFRTAQAAAPTSSTSTTTVEGSSVGNVPVNPNGTEETSGTTTSDSTAPPPPSRTTVGPDVNLATPGNRPAPVPVGTQRVNTAKKMGINEPTDLDRYVMPPAGPTRSDTARTSTTSSTRSKGKVEVPGDINVETEDEKKARLAGKKRVCKSKDCSSLLDMYNEGSICGLCISKEKERERQELLEIVKNVYRL